MTDRNPPHELTVEVTGTDLAAIDAAIDRAVADYLNGRTVTDYTVGPIAVEAATRTAMGTTTTYRAAALVTLTPT